MARPGTGHIERLPSGSCRVHVYAGADRLTGRRLRYWQTVETEKQAQAVLGKLLAQAAQRRRPDMYVTVADVLARYMAVAELDPSTRNTYAGCTRRTTLPALGSMDLHKVRGPLLDTFYARLRRCGDLTCTGRPSTEHRRFPGLTIEPDDSRSVWRRASAAIREAADSAAAPGEE
jgi:integrase